MVRCAVGCGKRFYGKDWIHIDGDTHFEHVVHSDVSLKMTFEDDSVDLIFACHFLEYFDRTEVVTLLNGWKDKLKTGGILRIAVPDFDAMVELYDSQDVELKDIIGPIHGLWSMNGKTIIHKTSWNFKELTELLTSVGFHNVCRYDWRKTEHSHIDDHSSAHLPHDPIAIETRNFDKHTLISLNIQCEK